MKRSISIDTETTGSNFQKGDRVIEVGLVELVDGSRTGNTFQTYLNMDQEVGWYPFKIHGISNEFLKDKPRFEDMAEEILAFIDGAPCLAHGARFDRDALINEFHVTGLALPELKFFDTVPMAKRMVGGPKLSLDLIIEELGIVTPSRDLHGALLDADILAMIVETFEAKDPGFVEKYLKAASSLDPLPKFLATQVSRSGAIDPTTGWVSRMGVIPVNQQLDLAAPQHGSGNTSAAIDDGDLNPGVARKISKINATTGEITKVERRLFRTGGNDGWSSTTVKEAATFAVKMHGKDAIREALKEARGRQIEKGMRWICRGVTPERVGAFITSINRNNKDINSTTKLDMSLIAPDADDTPGIG